MVRARCDCCHRFFRRRADNQKYCSKKCWHTVYYREVLHAKKIIPWKVIVQPCKWCRVPFESYVRNHRLYCSKQCYYRMHWWKHESGYYKQKRKYTRPCKACKTVFVTRWPAKKFCNEFCANIWTNYRHGKVFYSEVFFPKCGECGKAFMTKYKWERYCSEECSDRVFARRLFFSRLKRGKKQDNRQYLKSVRKFWIDHHCCSRCGDKLPEDYTMKTCDACAQNIVRRQQGNHVKKRREWFGTPLEPTKDRKNYRLVK